MTFQIVSAGIGLVSGVMSNRSADRRADRAEEAGQPLVESELTGTGGLQGQVNATGAGGQFDTGNLAGPQAAFATVAGQGARAASNRLSAGVPQDQLGFNDRLNNQDLNLGSFGQSERGAQRLQQQALGQAFNIPGQSNQRQRDTLSLLRSQAAPEQARQLQNFSQGLFQSGRGAVTGAEGSRGSVGGGALAAAFAEGQGRQDLGFQLASFGEGRAESASQDQLLNQAFNRFGTTTGLASDLNRSAFGRERGQLTEGFGRAQSLATEPARIAGAFQNVAGAASGASIGIQGLGLNAQQIALGSAQAGSNAANSVQSNLIGVQGIQGSGDNQAVLGAISDFATQVTPGEGILSRFGQPGTAPTSSPAGSQGFNDFVNQ